MSEIKPCPFCGEDIDMFTSYGKAIKAHSCTSCYIRCSSCDEVMTDCVYGKRYETQEELEERAIKKWNTRYIGKDLKIALDSLEEYNKWRRGDETLKMPNAKELGKTIDYIVDYFKNPIDNPAE